MDISSIIFQPFKLHHHRVDKAARYLRLDLNSIFFQHGVWRFFPSDNGFFARNKDRFPILNRMIHIGEHEVFG